MDFNLLRTSCASSNQDPATANQAHAFLQEILDPSLVSISLDKTRLLLEPSEDYRITEKHVLINPKFLKRIVNFVIASRSIQLSKIVNIFCSDFTLFWNCRREKIGNHKFTEERDQEEVALIRAASLYSPKSAELWSYATFLLESSPTATDKFVQKLPFEDISRRHFSNYNFWRFVVRLIETQRRTRHESPLPPVLTFEGFTEKIFKKSVSDSAVAHAYGRLFGPGRAAQVNRLVNSLILTYHQGLASLWSLKLQLIIHRHLVWDPSASEEAAFLAAVSGPNVSLLNKFVRALSAYREAPAEIR